MLKLLLHSLLTSFLLLGCVAQTPNTSKKPETLTVLLQSLSPDIPHAEAVQLTQEIFEKTRQLRENFDPVSSPHINNFLINVGLKEKGLCYEWSDALYAYFKKQNYPHFDFHLLVSDKGGYFLEHNVMVVTAKEGEIMEGVIIDPWRNPGEVYVSKVREDTAYRWEHRAERECKVH